MIKSDRVTEVERIQKLLVAAILASLYANKLFKHCSQVMNHKGRLTDIEYGESEP